MNKQWIMLVLLAVVALPCLADGGGGRGGGGSGGGRGGDHDRQTADPLYGSALAAIKVEDYRRAISLLQAYVATQPQDADAENWLGYAYRKSGQLEPAFAHYDRALALNPRHRGAHEYVGEAWLQAGRLDMAEQHLAALDKLCWLPCEQYSDLKAAIAAYKDKPPVNAAPPASDQP